MIGRPAMKWFKHHCDQSRTSSIAAYVDSCKKPGEGYGILGFLLEIVAEQITPSSPEPIACFSLRRWSRHLYCHHHTVTKYFDLLEEAGVVKLEYDASNISVEVPMLSDLADEYMVRKGQDPDTVRKRRTKKSKSDQSETVLASLPQSFKLTDVRRQVATENCPTVDVERCFAKFLANVRATRKSSGDWDQEWVLWTLREGEFFRKRSRHSSAQSKEERRRRDLLGMSDILDIQQTPDELEIDYIDRLNAANERRLKSLVPTP